MHAFVSRDKRRAFVGPDDEDILHSIFNNIAAAALNRRIRVHNTKLIDTCFITTPAEVQGSNSRCPVQMNQYRPNFARVQRRST